MSESILFANISWMEHYKGPDNDPASAGHSWFRDHDWGEESWNFLPHRGRLYGYVPMPSIARSIDIARLGASAEAETISGVTVVWLAKSPSPEQNFKTCVVGWFRNATIAKKGGHWKVKRGKSEIGYQIQASPAEARLLNPAQRGGLLVPTAKSPGNMGQSSVWYGNPAFISKVRRYINDFEKSAAYGPKRKTAGSTGNVARQSDPDLRRKIEKAAMDHATNYYTSLEGGARDVTWVDREKVGWDLRVSNSGPTLKVEVKGLFGRRLVVELTPNEYAQMMSKEHRRYYVVYVLTAALTPKPRAHIFQYNAAASAKSDHVWLSQRGERLAIQELTGARLTVG